MNVTFWLWSVYFGALGVNAALMLADRRVRWRSRSSTNVRIRLVAVQVLLANVMLGVSIALHAWPLVALSQALMLTDLGIIHYARLVDLHEDFARRWQSMGERLVALARDRDGAR